MRFLLQMAGRSGAGKSAVAAGISGRTGAVVVDLDVLKSTALDVGVTWDVAGQLAYRSVWAVAESLLSQGFSVICDSPCRFENIVAETMAVAERQNVAYRFVECAIPDRDELDRRLRARPRRRSQVMDARSMSSDAPQDSDVARRIQAGDDTIWATVYPPTPWLRLDTTEPLETSVDRALAYLEVS